MEFRILGPLEVLEQGAPLPLGGPQPRAVLCLLLLRANQVVSSDLLIDELWGSDPPPTAAKTLRVYISRLRKLLGDRLPSRGPGYLVKVGEDELDLARFENLRAKARELPSVEAAEALREALGMWRGPPLADFAYEAWAQPEIARLEELRLACLEERIEVDLALARHAELVGELEALVGKHPLRERLRGQLMLALYRSGRQAEALQAYQDARAVLVDELGIDPSPELQRLEKAILVQDAELAPPLPPRTAPEPAAVAEAEATPAPTPARETRKTVTIVFVDLAESSGLSEALDPEALRSVLDRYFDTLAGVLRRHGGTVEKFIGDAVMCVFGVPTLHDDDAMRAVRAAAEVGEELERLNDELEPRLGMRLAIRIGISTGEVVVGDPSGGDRLVTGDAVSVAAGLQQSGAPGDVVLGGQTWRLVRDAVRVEALEPLALKRRREPVEAYRLLELLPGAAPFARRLDVPLVGREPELAQLRQAFERAVRGRTAVLFTMLAPAGVGKSRLVAELEAELGDEVTVLRGACLSYGEGITFWPLAEMARSITGDDPRADLAELLAGEDDGDVIADRFMAAIGLTEDAPPAAEGAWAVRRLFEALAHRRPLVAVFEDVHWAESTLLDVIEHVADLSRDVPILLLCLARTELLDERPGWAGGKLNASSILLEPLSEAECVTLVDELAPQGLDARARGRIVHASEGNPLFVEQMLALMTEQAGDEPTLPPTIQSLLAARIDLLPPDERAILERAAVEGRQFHLGGVAALLGDETAAVHAGVLALVRKELVRPERPSLPGEEAFRFRHILVREAAYGALPKAARAELHEGFAGWLEAKTADRSVEFDEIVGYHLEQAVRYRDELGLKNGRNGELADAAAERLGAAGRRARARGDSPAAANLLSRSCGLLPAGSALRPELLVDLGVALVEVGQLDEGIEALREAERDAAADERVHTHSRLARLLAESYREPEGIAETSYAEGMRAIAIFERHADERGLARAWRAVAECHSIKARAAEMEEAARRIAEHAARADDRQLEVSALAMRVGAIALGPRPVAEGIALLEELLEQSSGLLRAQGLVLKELGLLHAMNGDAERGRELVGRSLALSEELGLRLAQVNVQSRAGLIELIAGEWKAAERRFRTICDELTEMGERSYLSTEAAYLGRALFELGRHGEADEATRLSEEAAATDDLVSQVQWRGVRARILAERGAPEAAEELAREAVGLAASTDFLDMHGDACRHLAAVLASAGRVTEAKEVAEQALRLHEQKGNALSAAAARKLLDELSLAPSL